MSNNDIINSLNSSFVKNGWAFGELFNRIGNPFQWVDGDQLNGLGSNNPSVNLMQYLTMSGEIYDLFNLIKYNSFLDSYNLERKLTAAEKKQMNNAMIAAGLRFYLSRLVDMIFPKVGEITHIKDPSAFETIIKKRINSA